jgi:antitoxin component YwqK of YwqJK toxin-antitoxin module
MPEEHILKVSEIMDDSRQIRPRYPCRESGWVPHGSYTGVDEDGRILLKITYDHGVVDGPFLDYWPSGKVASEGQFQAGIQEGIWHFYNEDGTLLEVIHFKQGKEIIDWDRFFKEDKGEEKNLVTEEGAE